MGIIPGEVAVSWAKIIRKYNWPDTLEKDIQKACEEYARNLSDYKAKQLAEKDAEIERLREIIRKIPMKCPHCLSKLKIDAIERQDWIAAAEYRTLIKALAGGEE
jgi:hypothetical protein